MADRTSPRFRIICLLRAVHGEWLMNCLKIDLPVLPTRSTSGLLSFCLARTDI